MSLIRRFALTHRTDALLLNEIRSFFRRKSNFVILGSGSSINELDVSSYIDESTFTIGFNFWIYNEFVPDLYIFEIKPSEVFRFIFWTNLLKSREKEFSDVKFVIKDSELDCKLNGKLVDDHFPVGLRHNLYFSKDAPIFGSSLFRIVLVFLARSVFHSQAVKKYRGTLSFCLELVPNASNVKLLGIDFDDRPHFWNASNYKNIGLKEFRHKDSIGGNIHKTVDPKQGVPIQAYLKWRIRSKKLKVEHILRKSINLGNL